MNNGRNAQRVFAEEGKSLATQLLYNETVETFGAYIYKNLTLNCGGHLLIDYGTHTGELLRKVLVKSCMYRFHSIGIDLDAEALNKNEVARKKIHCDLSSIPLPDNFVDVGIARYILVWNPAEKQKKILKEIARTTAGFTLIQHAGADNDNPDAWRKNMDVLLRGKEISKVKRLSYYFSTRDEIESWMQESHISFERLNERKVDYVSDVFKEKYDLTRAEDTKVKKILGNKDNIIQTTWVIHGVPA